MRMQIFACVFLCLAGCGQAKKNEVNNKKVDSSSGNNKSSSIISLKKKKQIITGPLPSFAKAHPNAKLLLNETFYFNTVDEAAPFGNEDGADSYLAFKDWRYTHQDNDPKEFLFEHIDDLGYPKFDINETDIQKLTPYLQQHEFGSRLVSGTDAIIVAIAFGQLYLEGTIDNGFKEIARASIIRQLLPDLLAMWGEPYQTERKAKLTKMLAVLNK
ncbi:MAG: hypothetical protein ABI402_13980 [Ferruginibacter sp.]